MLHSRHQKHRRLWGFSDSRRRGCSGCNSNSGCSSGWCEGGTVWSEGCCGSKVANGGSSGGDRNKCTSGKEQCGRCVANDWYGVPTGYKCTKNSNCVTGWCQGGTAIPGCNGTCQSKVAIGKGCTHDANCASGNCMNQGVTSRCSSTCGPSKEGGPCDEDSDCTGNNMFCLGGQTGISCGKCTRKMGNGEGTCTTNDDCQAGDCRGISCAIPGSTVRGNCRHTLCYAEPGFPDGTYCTEDRDCDQANSWCKGGGVGLIGTCSACPEKCAGQGCNACNNDMNNMVCGKTDATTKATCTAKIVAEVLTPAFDCFTKQYGASDCLSTAVSSVSSCMTGGSCQFKYGEPTCSSLGASPFFENQALSDQRRLGEPVGRETASVNIDLPLDESFEESDEEELEDTGGERRRLAARRGPKTTGNININGGFLFTLDPKNGKMIAEVRLDVEATAKASYSDSTGQSGETKRALSTKKVIFNKFALIGKFPVHIQATVQPMVWNSWAYSGSGEASVTVTKKATMTGSIEVSGLAKTLSPKLQWADSPMTVTPVLTGSANAQFTYRIGPRFVLTFNGMKATADGAFALKASADLALQGSCLAGSMSIGASADVSHNAEFEAPDPAMMAKGACLQAVDFAFANPAGALGSCVVGALTGTDPKEKMKDACDLIATDINDGESNAVSCAGATNLAIGAGEGSGRWTSFPLASASVTLENLCPGNQKGSTSFEGKSSQQVYTPPADCPGGVRLSHSTASTSSYPTLALLLCMCCALLT